MRRCDGKEDVADGGGRRCYDGDGGGGGRDWGGERMREEIEQRQT